MDWRLLTNAPFINGNDLSFRFVAKPPEHQQFDDVFGMHVQVGSSDTTMRLMRCYLNSEELVLISKLHMAFTRIEFRSKVLPGGDDVIAEPGQLAIDTPEWLWRLQLDTISGFKDVAYTAIERPIHPSDIHATMLHAFGLDQNAITFNHHGRQEIITNLGGSVVTEVFG